MLLFLPSVVSDAFDCKTCLAVESGRIRSDIWPDPDRIRRFWIWPDPQKLPDIRPDPDPDLDLDPVHPYPNLLLMTNRKVHMRFQLTPRSMTLEDLDLL